MIKLIFKIVLGIFLIIINLNLLASEKTWDRNTIKQLIVKESANTTVPASLALAVAKVESDFQPGTLGSDGRRGVMQISPEFAKSEFGIKIDELWEPKLNIQLGLDLLQQAFSKHQGNIRAVIADYHNKQWDKENSLYAVKSNYIDTILRWQYRYASQASIWNDSQWKNEEIKVLNTLKSLEKIYFAKTDQFNHYPLVSENFIFGQSLDDFDYSIELKRRLNKGSLDDFTAQTNWYK